MKIIILNRKRLGVTIIIIGLMLVLVGAEIKLSERLKMTALIQHGFNSLKQYEIKEINSSYKLPDDWESSEKDFGGEEIIYHNDFTSKEGNIHGFVEVWNSRQQDLKAFLEKSKVSAYEPDKVKDFKYNPVKINNNSGYLLTYTASTASGKEFKAYEYFFDNKTTFFRMAFYVQEGNFKENMPTIFEAMANTYERKDELMDN